MDRVFLDANVLFSAAYRPNSTLLRLWDLKGAELITSTYALEEAHINLQGSKERSLLNKLASSMKIIDRQMDLCPPEVMNLPDKDRPILMAAIDAKATHLLTGDIRHFGPYYGQTVKGVLILPPAAYLNS